MKKLIGVFLILALMLSLSFTIISCGERKIPYYSEGLEYTINADGKSYSVTGIGTATDTDIVIASVYEKLPVTSIDEFIFDDCDNIRSITIPDSVTSIHDFAFINYKGLSIIVDEKNTAFKDIDGNLYTKDGKTLLKYATGKTDTSFIIPDGVETIGKCALYNCDSLTSVTISDSVTTILDNAFYACDSLTSVAIPNSVTLIELGAFGGCNSLTSVVIGNSVSEISSWAFYNSPAITNITVAEDNSAYKSIDGNLYTKDGKTLVRCATGKNYTSFTVSNSVTSIDSHAFDGCASLESITIPNSVKGIRLFAFRNCDNLTDIYYTGSEEEWAKLNSPFQTIPSNLIIHYNSSITNDNNNTWNEDGNAIGRPVELPSN